MSAERTMPPAAAARPVRKLLLFVLGLILVAVSFTAGMRFAERRVAFSIAPGGTFVAYATERTCTDGPCQVLWIGRQNRGAAKVATLGAADGTCDEIVWTPDGKRVGFLVAGYQLRMYDAETLAPAGGVDLIEPEGRPSARIARGVTFSGNGRAATFDDCPRSHSGCRAGLAAIPY